MISCCWAVAESHRLPEHPGVYCGELCCFKKQAARYGMEVTSMTSIFMAQGVMGCQKDGDPGKIRTSDLRFRKPSLYPPELRGHEKPALNRVAFIRCERETADQEGRFRGGGQDGWGQ